MSILFFTLSIATLCRAVAAENALHLQHPVAQHRVHRRLIQEKLRDVEFPRPRSQLSTQGQGQRHVQVTTPYNSTDDCAGEPFLWKITEDATGKHVGFGLGTMHLPVEVVTSVDGFNSILAAIEDSCDVYGEIGQMDENTIMELTECVADLAEDWATIEDIPDGDLKKAINAKLLDITTIVKPFDPELAGLCASYLSTLPVIVVQNIILCANTPEYRDVCLPTYFSDEIIVSLDDHVVALGRPSGGLEKVSTHCDVLKEFYPSAEDLNGALEMNTMVLIYVNATLSSEIQMYLCGDVDAIIEKLGVELSGNPMVTDILLDNRNKQMAEKMNDILKENPDERILFAVGLAHWNIGSNSLELLLKDYGYTLEHIPEWNREFADDHSDDHCGVVKNLETGLFDPVLEGLLVPGTVLTNTTMAPTQQTDFLEPSSMSSSAPTAMGMITAPLNDIHDDPGLSNEVIEEPDPTASPVEVVEDVTTTATTAAVADSTTKSEGVVINTDEPSKDGVPTDVGEVVTTTATSAAVAASSTESEGVVTNTDDPPEDELPTIVGGVDNTTSPTPALQTASTPSSTKVLSGGDVAEQISTPEVQSSSAMIGGSKMFIAGGLIYLCYLG